MIFGLLQLPWWGYLVVLMVLTQLTIFSVTLYLHRTQAHRALDLHPIVSHFFRFWLWLTTGMITKEWTAIHRKHHAKVEKAEDPHSPQVKGIRTVFWRGAELYRLESVNQETLERYGHGTPDDWIERHLYTKRSTWGITAMLIINLVLFGPLGLSIWALQMAWIPFFAAGVVNGIGHYWGYRNYESKDASRNVIPWGILIGGEELHNNHHAFATSAKFSAKWWEIDLGWYVIRALQLFGLAKPKRTVPAPKIIPSKTVIDKDTLTALIMYRMQLMAHYSREVIMPAIQMEKKRASKEVRKLLRKAKSSLVRDKMMMQPEQEAQLAQVLASSPTISVVYQFRTQLQDIWARTTASQKDLVEALQDWCKRAEETGIENLNAFVLRLKMVVPQK